jgi:hypothetical protein
MTEVEVTPTTERTDLDKILCESEHPYEDFSPNMREAYRTALVLFDAHTHCTDMEGVLISSNTPRVAILSDKPNSGKTTVLEISRLLSYRGRLLSARNTTAPGLRRAIQEEKAALFLDQLERMISHFGTGFANRIDIFETGYARNAESLDANGFHPSFAPLAFTCLQSMFLGNPNLNALRTRSIMIFQEPLPPGMLAEDDMYDPEYHEDYVKAIGARLDVAVRTVLEDIKACRPEMPDNIRLRTRQIWRPLARIAAVAGGQWPARCVSAMREIALGLESSKLVLSPAEQLWQDIKIVVEETSGHLTIEAIAADIADADLPSAAYWATPRQASNAVGRVMRDHDMEATRVWYNKTARPGYKREDLVQAFSLSLSPLLSEALTREEESA